jgi:DNA-binding transcriptional LysR family regulator
MRNLPTDLLRSFVTVAELKGFTPAAELLGRSQPAISLQIKRLEQLLGRQVLSRAGHRLDLTPAGEELFRYARQILAINDEALARLGGGQVSGRLRFGIPSEFATTLLPKIIGRFIQAYPGVTLEVSCELSKQLLAPEQRKQFDLILALQDDPRARPESRVKVDDLVWVSGPEYDVHQQDKLSLIAAPEGCIYRKRGVERLDCAQVPWRIVYTIPDLTGIQAAIEEGLGVTVLARSTVPENLRIIRSGGRFPALGKVGISLLHRAGDTSEAAARLADYVRASLN